MAGQQQQVQQVAFEKVVVEERARKRKRNLDRRAKHRQTAIDGWTITESSLSLTVNEQRWVQAVLLLQRTVKVDLNQWFKATLPPALPPLKPPVLLSTSSSSFLHTTPGRLSACTIFCSLGVGERWWLSNEVEVSISRSIEISVHPQLLCLFCFRRGLYKGCNAAYRRRQLISIATAEDQHTISTGRQLCPACFQCTQTVRDRQTYAESKQMSNRPRTDCTHRHTHTLNRDRTDHFWSTHKSYCSWWWWWDGWQSTLLFSDGCTALLSKFEYSHTV